MNKEDSIQKEEKKIIDSVFKKNDNFKNCIIKLTTETKLSFSEKSFILSVSQILLQEYQKDRRYRSYAELAYYIILKYSTTYNDYIPLNDFSINFGFYPIQNLLIENGSNFLEQNIRGEYFSIHQLLANFQLPEFDKIIDNKEHYIETIEQNKISSEFLESQSKEKGFIAPTSFGKSSIIIDYIKSLKASSRIVIVVPTKSLLMQTFKLIRDKKLNYKLLIHEDMYMGENQFIAIFTQERALRFIRNQKEKYFDTIIIDEAHNLLKKIKSGDNRSLLLSRLIRLNSALNPNQSVIYLSPLVNDINSLKINSNQTFTSHTIHFNIKAPEYYEYKIDKTIVIHNRFFISKSNTGFEIGQEANFFNYIISKSGSKNFIYYSSPPYIEKLALELSKKIDKISFGNELNSIVNTLKIEVHESFYGIELIKHGIIYLHGKLPDLIKEYLEYKFKNCESLKYVIANSVILEGINLPIDSLFILDTYRLHGKELTNLIGRVNRLNDIFIKHKDLKKLLPKVHFVNNDFGKKNLNMFNKIIELRSRIFEDKIENPTLDGFEHDKKTTNEQKERIDNILKDENFLINSYINEDNILQQYLIDSGINLFYNNTKELLIKIQQKIDELDSDSEEWAKQSMISKIYTVFIEPFNSLDNSIVDFEFARLKEAKAREFYEVFILNKKNSLKQNVNNLVKHLLKRKQSSNEKDYLYYIGGSYGETQYNLSGFYKDIHKRNVAIDLRGKSETEIVNYAIVKIKMEDDFISYKINKFVVFLHDFKLIEDKEYNMYIYGTNDSKKISLTKFGLNISTIEKLSQDNQLINLSLDNYNNLIGNSKFYEYLETLNDFQRFEIERFLN